jgi:hypothetical protein
VVVGASVKFGFLVKWGWLKVAAVVVVVVVALRVVAVDAAVLGEVLVAVVAPVLVLERWFVVGLVKGAVLFFGSTPQAFR